MFQANVLTVLGIHDKCIDLYAASHLDAQT